ncbi:MAG: hypothetical protein VCA73_12730 [Roseibacillus sp.]|jgi:hypothetical protein
MTSLAVLGLSLPAIAQEKERPGGDPTVESPDLKVQGRAVLIAPNGTRREFSFGDAPAKKLKKRIADGGVHLELKLAPDMAALEKFKARIEKHLKTAGLDAALLELALSGLKNIDDFGDVQIRGLAVGPDGKAQKLEFGDDLEAKARKFDRKMQDGGGVQLELGLKPNASLMQLLNKILQSPAALDLLEQGRQNPEALNLLEQAAKDPKLMDLLAKGAQDPQLMKLLQEGLEDADLSALLAQQLNNGNAEKWLELLRSPSEIQPKSEAAPPEEDESKARRSDSQEKDQPGRDAEILELRRELAEQRALLNKILGKLK